MIDSKQLVKFAKQPELALKNLNELLVLLDSEDETEQGCATDLLENCGVPSRSDAPFLCEQMRSRRASRVYWCSTLLGRLGQTVTEPAERGQIQAELCNAINDDSIELSARERAAWAIGELGSVDDNCRAVLEMRIGTAPPRLKRLLESALGS